jgi:hypothetical protein
LVQVQIQIIHFVAKMMQASSSLQESEHRRILAAGFNQLYLGRRLSQWYEK